MDCKNVRIKWFQRLDAWRWFLLSRNRWFSVPLWSNVGANMVTKLRSNIYQFLAIWCILTSACEIKFVSEKSCCFTFWINSVTILIFIANYFFFNFRYFWTTDEQIFPYFHFTSITIILGEEKYDQTRLFELFLKHFWLHRYQAIILQQIPSRESSHVFYL